MLNYLRGAHEALLTDAGSVWDVRVRLLCLPPGGSPVLQASCPLQQQWGRAGPAPKTIWEGQLLQSPFLISYMNQWEARMVAVGPHLIEGGGGTWKRLQFLISCSLSIADNEKEAGKINGDKCPWIWRTGTSFLSKMGKKRTDFCFTFTEHRATSLIITSRLSQSQWV